MYVHNWNAPKCQNPLRIKFVCFDTVSSAIVCYQCNSEYDPRCGDPFDAYSLGQVNCSMKVQLEHLPGKEPVLCRKTRQKSTQFSRFIFAKHFVQFLFPFFSVFGKVRIVRDCGYVENDHDDRQCFRRTGTFEVESIFCSCTSDLCNSTPASTHQSAFSVMGYLMIALVPLLTAVTNGKLCAIRRLFQWKHPKYLSSSRPEISRPSSNETATNGVFEQD